MRVFERPLSPGETVLAGVSVLGLLLTAISNFATGHSRLPTVVALLFAGTVAAVWMGSSILRKSFVIEGYDDVMQYLETLAKSARLAVWTARTHDGEAEREERYFEVLCSRVTDPERPLPDFRRLMRMGQQIEPRRHARWLYERLCRHSTVQVRYFVEGGPKFDFLVIDHRIAVIGFPMPGGLGNMGAVVLKQAHAVRGVESVFEELWENSPTLFEGTGVASDEEQQTARLRFEELLSRFTPVGSALVPNASDKLW